MRGEEKGTKVKILEKDFRISCPKEKEEELFEAASYLDSQMRQIKSSGRVIGLERIAIMAALNISHELISLKNKAPSDDPNLSHRLQALHHKIDDALSEGTKTYDRIESESNFDDIQQVELENSFED